jgi:flagellar basal body-associated protein FliL
LASTPNNSPQTEDKNDSNATEALEGPKRRRLPGRAAVAGLGLFLLAAAATLGGFVAGAGMERTTSIARAVFTAPLPQEQAPVEEVVTLPDLIVNRGAPGTDGFLKARLAVVARPGFADYVEEETPTMLDIANGFLPQLDDIDLRGGAGLARTRDELRYRFNLVLQEEAVAEVLVLELVTN